MPAGRGPTRRLIVFVLGILFLFYVYKRSYVQNAVREASLKAGKINGDISKVLVVVTTKEKRADTYWVHEELPEWPSIIYVADDPSAPYHPEINKGNEANVYLTYIIAHYDTLPSVVIFTHDHNRAVHIDPALGSNANSVRRLNLTHVLDRGYQSLRCEREKHCVLKTPEYWSQVTPHYREAWEFAFRGDLNSHPCPEVAVAPCCAQFAVSGDAVRRRPKIVYERLQEWLLETDLNTMWSGRVFEYMWHAIFGKPGIFCVDQDRCYCQAFGLCDADPARGWWPDESLDVFKEMRINETINE